MCHIETRRPIAFRPNRLWLAFAIGCITTGSVSGQSLPIGDPLEDYIRVLQTSGRIEGGSFLVRPLPVRGLRAALDTLRHPWQERPIVEHLLHGEESVRVEVAGVRLFRNSAFPYGQNDDAVWQGRGVTAAWDVGVSAHWRGLSASFAPTLIYTKNLSFELAPVATPGMPIYAYPWRPIDLPQRFGPKHYWTLSPGQSEVRASFRGAAVSLGTRSLWWGSSLRNAIVMSNNAPGFPHLSVGTDGGVGIGIGQLEVQWIWGDLDDSGWFRPDFDRDRYVTGVVFAYSPSFIEGLTLGATRVFYALVPEGGVPFGDYFLIFQGVRKEQFASDENPGGNDEYDQLFSLLGRWVIADGGFEVYAEWARNDHAWDFRDLSLEPEHTQAYTLGLLKTWEIGLERLLAFNAELTGLQGAPTRALRATPTYYAHHRVLQGYTHEGQVIGAGVGPGGDSQFLGLDLYTPRGRIGAFLQRDIRDNDAYYSRAPTDPSLRFRQHDVMLHAGSAATAFLADFEVGARLVLTRELNRYFEYERDVWNSNLTLTAEWHP